MNRILFITTIFIIISCNAKTKEYADRIYTNGLIWTGDSIDIVTGAIAIKGNKIMYIGDNFQNLKDKNTVIVDLRGQLIVPGFIDNHTHFLSGGYQLANINLRPIQTKEDFRNTIESFASKIPRGQWILGGDWDHEAWGGDLPDKSWIDSVTPNNPVFVSRYDGHMGLANSAALKLAGIDKDTKNPEGGVIVKDSLTGEPTGMLRDEAMSLVFKVIPEPSENELDESLQRALKEAVEFGVTEVNDMGSYGGWADLSTYRRAYRKNKLDIRVYAFVPLSDWEKLNSYVKENGRGDDRLRWGGLKGFVDGSLGSTTAWFYEPYLDDTTTSGLTITDTSTLASWIMAADSAGLQVAVHAIGDRGNDWLLNVYESAINKDKKDRRFRIEHAQHLTPEAIRKFGELNVIPSMQPYHAIDDGKWASKRLDDKRLKGTYAFKSLLDNGARLTFGSDWTVAPLSPILGIYAAVTRQTLDGKNPGGWYPEQKITVEQALKAYTQNSAYASYMETKTGILKPGFLADFVVLSENLFEITPESIKDVKVLRTIVDGKEVYKR